MEPAARSTLPVGAGRAVAVSWSFAGLSQQVSQ